jgi:hypothetical protein
LIQAGSGKVIQQIIQNTPSLSKLILNANDLGEEDIDDLFLFTQSLAYFDVKNNSFKFKENNNNLIKFRNYNEQRLHGFIDY